MTESTASERAVRARKRIDAVKKGLKSHQQISLSEFNPPEPDAWDLSIPKRAWEKHMNDWRHALIFATSRKRSQRKHFPDIEDTESFAKSICGTWIDSHRVRFTVRKCSLSNTLFVFEGAALAYVLIGGRNTNDEITGVEHAANFRLAYRNDTYVMWESLGTQRNLTWRRCFS